MCYFSRNCVWLAIGHAKKARVSAIKVFHSVLLKLELNYCILSEQEEVTSISVSIPWSLRRSERFSSTSGLSAFRTSFRHWLCKLLRVTVKFTNVTREQRSGGNSTYHRKHKKLSAHWHTISTKKTALSFAYCWISGGEEDNEGWWQINILVSQSNQNSASGSPDFTIQNGIQNWIIALHILKTEMCEREFVTSKCSLANNPNPATTNGPVVINVHSVWNTDHIQKL